MATSIGTITPCDKVDDVVELCIKSGVVPFEVGPPGIGKTASHRRVAENLEITFSDITLSDLDLPDLRLPYVHKGVMQFAFDERWPIERYREYYVKRGMERGLLLVDEITGCDAIMQRPIWRLALERKLGGESLLPGWSIALAGNGQGDRAGAQALSFPLTNRLCVIQVGAPSHQGWRKWAISSKLDSRVIGWISHSPDSLFKFEPDKYDAGVWAQPTPRSWERVSSILQHSKKLESAGVALAVQGLVGLEHATKALAWMKVGDDLPSIETILATGREEYPTSVGANMVLCAGLAARVEPEEMRMLAFYAKGLSKEYRKLLSTDIKQRGSRFILADGFEDLS